MDHIEKIMETIPENAFANRQGFTPKLNFQQRCEILAMFRRGISRNIIAKAYGIDRRTVTHIYNSKSPHYKAVRQELDRLGAEDFDKRYITEDAAHRISRTALATVRERKNPAKMSNRMAGVHNVQNEFCAQPHRIMVSWIEGEQASIGDGWYYQDFDGPEPEMWMHNGPDSIKFQPGVPSCRRREPERLGTRSIY